MQLLQTLVNGRPRQYRSTPHYRHATSAEVFRIRRSDQSPLPLVQMLEESLVPCAKRGFVLHDP
jgi:hypothetical protein